ncbi:hypothetical protein VDGL01_05532 [Verticillium dahliae]
MYAVTKTTGVDKKATLLKRKLPLNRYTILQTSSKLIKGIKQREGCREGSEVMGLSG